LGGDNPVDGSTFFIDYEYYQPRIDRIILRTDGVFAVVRGVPVDSPVAPKIPSEVLGVASVAIGANSATNILITQDDNLQVTMAMVRNAIRRQEDQRLNDALQDLINQVKLDETAAFKGVFADAFASEDMSDSTFDRPAGAGGASAGSQITYDALLDLFELLLLLPVAIDSDSLVRNNALIPSGLASCAIGRDFATLPYTEVLEIDQSQWSEELNVNPFATFTPPPPALTLIPDKDGGVDEHTSTINDIWLANLHNKKGRPIRNGEIELLNNHPHYRVRGRTVTELRRILNERAGTFMRPLQVEVRGTKFVPGEDDVTAKFDGKAVNLTPINSTPTGTLGGTLKARPSVFDVNNALISRGGDFEATFTVPANVPTGIRTLVVTGGSGSRSEAPYDGQFTERDITIMTRELIMLADPLAQSFGFSQPTTITRIRIPFANKGAASDSPLTVQLRTVELPGGFPGRTYFDEIVRKAENLVVGPDSVNEFVFNNPLYIPANTLRSVVLMSDANNYYVYTATLGRTGARPVAYITENPNIRGMEPAGILLESLNAVNWEAQSRSALRYQVYRAQFAAESWLHFDRISGVNYSQVVLMADTLMPQGTSIEWSISTDGLAVGSSVIAINPFDKLDLRELVSTIDVRAKLTTSDMRVTPYVEISTVALQGIRYESAGKYISKRADVLQDIESVKFYFEINRPAVVTVSYFVSNAEDVSGDPIWESVATVDSDVDLGDGFHAIVMSKTLNNGIANKVNFRKLRVRVDQATSNQAFSAAIRNLAATFV
jgi:hypothetical protein